MGLLLKRIWGCRTKLKMSQYFVNYYFGASIQVQSHLICCLCHWCICLYCVAILLSLFCRMGCLYTFPCDDEQKCTKTLVCSDKQLSELLEVKNWTIRHTGLPFKGTGIWSLISAECGLDALCHCFQELPGVLLYWEMHDHEFKALNSCLWCCEWEENPRKSFLLSGYVVLTILSLGSPYLQSLTAPGAHWYLLRGRESLEHVLINDSDIVSM